MSALSFGVILNVCSQAAELGKPGLVKIRPLSDRFSFVVESTGALPSEEVVQQAFGILQNKLDLLKVLAFEILPHIR